MIKEIINYEDYNGDNKTKECYFHLKKTELLELEKSYPGGLSSYIKSALDNPDGIELILFLKDVILESYGIKSNDGDRFIKSEEIREMFEQSEVFEIFLFDLVNDEQRAVNFIKGVLPKSLSEEIDNLYHPNN